MITYKTLLEEGRSLLKKADVTSYLIDARVLLENASGKPYTYLFNHYDEVASEEVVAQFKSFIERRARHEPVSKIIEHKEFWGLSFITTKATLDPRPESETLIEAVLNEYPETLEKLDFLELGVGTGCLLFTLLHLYTFSQGVGVDLSKEALEVAARNAENLKVSNRVTLQQSSWFDAVPKQKFDIILSNPPYIQKSDEERLSEDVKYDPAIALYGGDDGLDAYRALFQDVGHFLKPGGLFILEHGMGQEGALEVMGRAAGFSQIQGFKDLAGIWRIMAFRV